MENLEVCTLAVDAALESLKQLRSIVNDWGICQPSQSVWAPKEGYFLEFMDEEIRFLVKCNKARTAETHKSALCSFRKFLKGTDVTFNEITSDLMVNYEAYLISTGVIPNTSSFYMRILRAVYNKAVEKGLTYQRYPFKRVYTGIEKTTKRALSLGDLKKIKELQLTPGSKYDFAKDMFIFSFYTRGMSFIDMAYLKKSDLRNGVLTYRRRKTGQKLDMRWEGCMQEVVDKYNNEASPYLLPIIDPLRPLDERMQYIYMSHNINKYLKHIGKLAGLSIPLTMYCARHSWASAARSKNVPLAIISEGMGHDSENTTKIYLSSLDSSAIDDANNLILQSI